MRKQIKKFLVVGSVVLGGCQAILPYSMAHATEIIDEKGEKWTDIAETIKRWPLNTFNTMYISEYDFLNNGLSVVFNGISTSGDGSWKANELLMGWVNYSGMFQRDEFAGLISFDETDRYIPLIQLKMDESISSGTEIEITSEMITGRILDNFYEKKLAYVMRNGDGEATRANYNSAFQCAVEVREGQVCRLFYKDPTPEGGASSGLTKYFPVQKTEVNKEGPSGLTTEVGTGEEVEKNEPVIGSETEDNGLVAEIETGEKELILDVESPSGTEVDDKNTSGDIENDVIMTEESKSVEKYSSGDIFAAEDNKVTSVVNNKDAEKVAVAALSAGRNHGGDTGGGADATTDGDRENNISEVEKLIRASEEEKAAEEGINKIEVPRLGMTAKEIDYKWLFLPVLGLILMLYWWFLVPIFKKREKSAKKSKKSVDNI